MADQEALKNDLEKTRLELSGVQNELQRREQLALTDELTGLSNRRALNIRLAEETQRYKRYGAFLSVVIVDLDDFKKVNDTYGHLVGDRLLAATAKLMKASIRETDFAARFGGEEFVVLCSHTDLAGAEVLAERLRRVLEQMEFTVKGKRVSVTMSCGVACIRADDDAAALTDRADKCLYQAKKTGKNRVVCEKDLEGAK